MRPSLPTSAYARPRALTRPYFAPLALLALCLLAPAAADAQWTQPDAGNNISTTSSVGVGTTTPSAALHVFRNFGQGSSGTVAVVGGKGMWNVGDYERLRLGFTQFDSIYDNAGWAMGFRTGASDGSGVERLRITSAGNVGIGTTSPDTRAHVVMSSADANIESGANAAQGLTLSNSDATPNNYTSLVFSDGAGQANFAGMFGVAADHANNYGDLAFVTRGAGGYRERLRVTGAGNVGVGTAAPAYPLSVRRDSPGVQHVLQIVDSTAKMWGPDVRDSIYFEGRFTGQASNWSVANINYGYTSHYNTGGATLAFDLVNTGGGWGNVMTLKGSGNVGLGTTTPGERLELYDPSATVKFKIGSDGAAANSYLVMNAAAGRASVIQKQTGGVNSGQVLLYASSDPSGRLFALDSSNNFGDIAAEFMVKRNGNVGIGTASPTQRLEVSGGVRVSKTAAGTGGDLSVEGAITGGTIQAVYQDVAEWVPSTQKLAAGTVVVLDAGRVNHVLASASAYDTKVAGVVSAEPGVILGVPGEGKVKVATTGRVKVRVDASRSPIKIGDLLVTSGAEGVAMKSEPLAIGGRQIHAPGTIIGKALEPLEKGTGEILVLLSLQ